MAVVDRLKGHRDLQAPVANAVLEAHRVNPETLVQKETMGSGVIPAS